VESTRTVTLNANLPRRTSVYGSATGRVVLAYLSQVEQDEYVRTFGLPGDQWSDASSPGALKLELERIRDAGMAKRLSEDGYAIYLAGLVFGPGHRVLASILVTLPTIRFHDQYQRLILSEGEASCTGDVGIPTWTRPDERLRPWEDASPRLNPYKTRGFMHYRR
jgi:DNA-binding IclR family transcriptional regulator